MIVYYAAMSLDGRIAGADHDLAFLQTLTGAENDYEVFYADVDSLIMGARDVGVHGRATARGRTAASRRGSSRTPTSWRSSRAPSRSSGSPVTWPSWCA